MARLLLIRHGQSVANAELRFTLEDDEPLTALGVDQARRTGLRLAERYRPSTLYSSPFERARHTAELIGEAFGLEPEILPLLHEQDYGELKGVSYQRYLELAPLTSGADFWRRRPPGGESLLDVLERVAPVLDDVARRHLGEETIIVSHGGVMAALRGHIAGLDGGPRSTVNADGYRVEGAPPTYRGPLALFDDGPEPPAPPRP